jgi:hypothetical protein
MKILLNFQVLLITGWLVTLSSMYAVIFGGFKIKQFDYEYQAIEAATYGALHRPLWALATYGALHRPLWALATYGALHRPLWALAQRHGSSSLVIKDTEVIFKQTI